MADKITIDIALHPLAWKVLMQQYNYDGKAVDVGHGWLYCLIVQGLERQHVITSGELRKKPKGLVDGKVYIYADDFLRYGRHLRLSRQANISRVIYRKERERLCNQIAVFHIATGIERNKVMRHFLEKADLQEDELSFEALKKYYQRHYRQKEDDILHDIKELSK